MSELMQEDNGEVIVAGWLRERRERVFLVLAGLFLGTLAMLNILGISRFIDMSFEIWGMEVPFVVAVGVLPYPITFLCTDLICELYGRKRANFLVWVGLILNAWVLFVMWLGGYLGGGDAAVGYLPDIDISKITDTKSLADTLGGESYAFYQIRNLTFAATFASMVAYFVAQLVDVQLFHFWKKLTKGKHLWLRNNGSTLVSQLVDMVLVILATYYWAGPAVFKLGPGDDHFKTLLIIIGSGYVFKLVVALLDTIPIYVCVGWLSKYLRIDASKIE